MSTTSTPSGAMSARHIPVAPGIELAVDTWPAAGAGAEAAEADARGGAAGPRAGAFLLVHGLASNARLWDGVAAHLASLGHPVATVDLRGHGRSAKPDDGYDIPTICDDLVAVLAALREAAPGGEWDRPVAVGQSWGANVVLELAFRQPDLLAGIACVDGGTINLQGRFPSWEECAILLAPPRLKGTQLSALEEFLRRAHATWPETGIQGTLANFEVRPDGTIAPWLTFKRHIMVLRGLWDHQPATRYPSIAVPVLLVPADDGHGPSTEAKRVEVAGAEAAVPTVSVQWFQAEHDIHAQRPVELAAALHQAGTDFFR